MNEAPDVLQSLIDLGRSLKPFTVRFVIPAAMFPCLARWKRLTQNDRACLSRSARKITRSRRRRQLRHIALPVGHHGTAMSWRHAPSHCAILARLRP